MLKLSDVFQNFIIINSTGDWVRVDAKNMDEFERNHTVRFKLWWRGCYRINFSALAAGDYTHQLYKKLPIASVFTMVLNKNITERAVKYFRGLLSSDFQTRLSGTTLQFLNQTMVVYTYRRRELHLMPAPFSTNCRDYGPLFTQDVCLTLCQFEMAIRQNRSLPWELSIPENVPLVKGLSPSTKSIPMSTDRDVDGAYTTIRNCGRQCRQLPCKLVEYVAKTMLTVKSDITAMRLALPAEPDIYVTYLAKMSTLEYLSMIASLLGMWLGINCLDFIKVFFFFNEKKNSSN